MATRAARPGQAVVLAAVFNMVGPLVLGAAVADTVAGIVQLSGPEMVRVVASGLLAVVVWNSLTLWKGLPSSSGHGLVGGLVGAALAEAGPGAVNWGGFSDGRPVGVIGIADSLVPWEDAPVVSGEVAASELGSLFKQHKFIFVADGSIIHGIITQERYFKYLGAK